MIKVEYYGKKIIQIAIYEGFNDFMSYIIYMGKGRKE